MSRDKSYKILEIIYNNPLFKNDLAKLCAGSYVTPSLMIKNRWIEYSGLSEDGVPIEPFIITDTGLEYLLSKIKDDKIFWRAFFSNFISGFIVGVLVAVFGAFLVYKLKLK